MTTLSDVKTVPATGLLHIDGILDNGPGWNWITPARNVLYYTFALNESSPNQGSLVTGPVTRNMRVALERTWRATPDPKWVVAVGDCARDGGCFAGSPAVLGGVAEVVPVDLHIPGCPPSPQAVLEGLVALLDR